MTIMITDRNHGRNKKNKNIQSRLQIFFPALPKHVSRHPSICCFFGSRQVPGITDRHLTTTETVLASQKPPSPFHLIFIKCLYKADEVHSVFLMAEARAPCREGSVLMEDRTTRRGGTLTVWLGHDGPLVSLKFGPHPPNPRAPSPGAGCQELLMNLFSRQPCYLGPWFRVRECTQWDLKPNHLLHSPTPLPDSQPSPFTKQQFLGTLSHRYLPFGMIGLSLTGPAVFVFVYCTSVFVCACATVHLSIQSRGYMCINVCVSVL